MAEITAQSHTVDLEEEARSIDNQKFAMWLFLASEIVIFTAMIAPWVVFRIRHADLVHQFHEDAGFIGILLVTFNTFLLLTSSWAMVMGLRQIVRGNVDGLVSWFWRVAGLGVAFLVLQYVEYQKLASDGVTLGIERDHLSGLGARFYGPTAFHGAHVFVGVLWCLLVIYRARKGNYSARNHVGVEVFGLYWHFVDVVWILLFTLIYLV
jgi:heme/copper-type cytochrome/quinol oxidase subunit 3